ncbi:MAG: hypothetical protein Q9159_005744 [Coniocarpon cinnabarinum]
MSSDRHEKMAVTVEVTKPTPHAVIALDLLKFAPRADAEDQIELNGFIRWIRKQKNKAFAAIDDGSSLTPLQAVLDPKQAKRSGDSANSLALHKLTKRL